MQREKSVLPLRKLGLMSIATIVVGYWAAIVAKEEPCVAVGAVLKVSKLPVLLIRVDEATGSGVP